MLSKEDAEKVASGIHGHKPASSKADKFTLKEEIDLTSTKHAKFLNSEFRRHCESRIDQLVDQLNSEQNNTEYQRKKASYYHLRSTRYEERLCSSTIAAVIYIVLTVIGGATISAASMMAPAPNWTPVVHGLGWLILVGGLIVQVVLACMHRREHDHYASDNLPGTERLTSPIIGD